jgi:D-alanyl-D-alanine endopeptidase (penicillin-binding protein 7)
MSRIKKIAHPDRQVLKWKTMVPVLALASACLAGCTQAPVAQDSAVRAVAAGADNKQKPVLKFASCSKPVWPKDALARRSQGTTTLRFLIDTDGSVAQSTVLKSSGDPSLDETARAAIAKCQFRPAVDADKKPARAWVPVQYVWTLDPQR